MPQLISEHQSAFLSDRLISDNIMVAFETLHHMRNHCATKKGYMALKLDMSKAYNRVEWEFMEKVMRKMGFDNRWLNVMMECKTTTSYSILINGEAHGDIKASRGLRQGNPLSPYLFFMCTKGLLGLIKKATYNGVSICRNGPKLTNLLFANDSLIFCRAKEDKCLRLLDILTTYERT